MDGCTYSTEDGRSSSTSRKRKHDAEDPEEVFLAFETRYTNDPLGQFNSRIMRMLRKNQSMDQLREQIEFVPESSPELLRSLSSHRFDAKEHVDLSLHLLLIIRECERIAKNLTDSSEESSEGRAEFKNSVRDLERIERNLADVCLEFRYDDFTMAEELQNGGVAGLDQTSTGTQRITDAEGNNPLVLRESHRMLLWATRCKVIDLLYNVGEHVTSLEKVNDPIRKRSLLLTDEELAKWMLERRVCDRSMIRFGVSGEVLGHKIGECSLLSLWLTLKMLVCRWPVLPYDLFVVRIEFELRKRVAFFMSYRESVDPRSRSGRAIMGIQNSTKNKVLGLPVSMWQVRDLLSRNSTAAAKKEVQIETLLNKPNFVRMTSGFAHINQRFVGETERVFASLERQIRSCSGLKWHLAPSEKCLACEELKNNGPNHVRTLERIFAKQMSGVFKEYVREAFQERIYSFYLEPSYAERFRRMNPADMASARNIISREKRELNRRINEEFIGPQMIEIWHALWGKHEEPAYTLLAGLAAAYAVQQRAKGAKLNHYIQTMEMLQPYKFSQERFAHFRKPHMDFYQNLVNTGTLRFRHKLVRAYGLSAPQEEISYPHPLILLTMNSCSIFYKNRAHRCPGGFGQAFLVWIAIMCRDPQICGQMPNNGYLHEMWSDLRPDRRKEIEQLRRRTEDRVNKWDPVKQILNCDKELARVQQDNSTQF